MTQQTVARSEAAPDHGGAVGLRVSGMDKIYPTRRGRVEALRGIDLDIGRGEFVSLVGRSGCGKTTLLRVLSGLLPPTAGTVEAGGRPVWVDGRRDDAAFASFGLVFQEANLFPWFSITDNVALPLKLRGESTSSRRARARELCGMVGLSGFEDSYPRELSGGMRQRAAIARALACDPSVLLMDEPFGALDALTRDRMNLELQEIHAASGATVVFVTHSIPEAVFLADRVVLLTPRPGRIRSVTEVGLARPRSMETETGAGFQDIVRGLRRELDEES
ncbi:ABC transporter ATP-binding protein [Pseudonocardia sp. KRD291]|uniref:ABC transporter ATP-binding protein n=1 Tax=Pseudonocardia sp. KRD291 TaxID=2792007 RepID=UPI001C4A29BE|nr:ABC transporter ATP-binding protein [Pseudonocardia sp. KRD291]MBW0106618.1 ABC transporter ATP-binding protein [Pseudonocardia sp. KRD291]